MALDVRLLERCHPSQPSQPSHSQTLPRKSVGEKKKKIHGKAQRQEQGVVGRGIVSHSSHSQVPLSYMEKILERERGVERKEP